MIPSGTPWNHRIIRVTLAICLLTMTYGCVSDSGIRALDKRELTYFTGLEDRLRLSEEGLKNQLQEDARINREEALREVSDLRTKVQMARAVYSVHELLKAPQNEDLPQY